MLSPSQVLYYHMKMLFTFNQDWFYSLRKLRHLKNRGKSPTTGYPKASSYGLAETQHSSPWHTAYLHGPTKVLQSWPRSELEFSWGIWWHHVKGHGKTMQNIQWGGKNTVRKFEAQALMILRVPVVCIVLRIIKMKTCCCYSQGRNLYHLYDNTMKLPRGSWNMDVLICNIL